MSKGTSIVSEIADIRERQRQLALQSGDAGDDPLLDFYVRVMAKMLDAERCSIFIREPDSGKVWLKCGTALGQRDIVVDIDTSIVGKVVKTGESVFIEGLEHLPGPHRAVDARTGFTTRNILCIPVTTLDGKIVAGAVQVLNKQGGRVKFTQEDETMLEDSAHFLQLAIETAFVNQLSAGALTRMTRYALGASALALVFALALLYLLVR
jgi:GAF domain-containing protein